jgi:pimeloyl-ACP methyl ester carboxylesterase
LVSVLAVHYLIGSFLVIIGAVSILVLSVHIVFRAPRVVERGSPKNFGLDYREMWIPTAKGKRLYAWFIPAAMPGPTLIILHGWGGNAEMMLPMAFPFHRAGMNVLLLDARNHGRSDSDSFSSLPKFAEDLGHTIDWIKASFEDEREKIALLGHSVGAGAVLLEASRRRDILAVIGVAAFAHPEWLMRRFLRCLSIPNLLSSLILRYVEWIIGYRYEKIAPINTACRVECPVLLVHGERDATIPVSDALAIKAHCKDKAVRILLIEDAGHNSARKVEEYGEQLIAFLIQARINESNSRIRNTESL